MIKHFFFLLSICLNLGALTPEMRLSEMTLEEKVGQLFAIPILFGEGRSDIDVDAYIQKYRIGSFILKRGSAKQHRETVDRIWPLLTDRPLTLKDAEWGVTMGLTEGVTYPRNASLGKSGRPDLVEEMGRQVATACRRIGVDINLAPVLDVNSNPDNPIINTRSFGEKAEQVILYGNAFIRGLQSGGVIACAKHFPGHGDTVADSHVSLPQIQGKPQLAPFRAAVNAGVGALMTGHLLMPRETTFPASLHPTLLSELPNFDGLVITDALNMCAITNHFTPAQAAIAAFKSGAHILLYGDHIIENVDHILDDIVPNAYCALLTAFKVDVLSERKLNERVLKILQIKASRPKAPYDEGPLSEPEWEELANSLNN